MVLLLETRQETSLLKCKEEEYKTNVSSSTPNNWLLFDEEVATLLLDMQQKVLDVQRTTPENNKLNDGASSVPSQDKQDNTIRNRKRKSPPDSDVESIEDEEEEEEFHHMEQEEDDDEWMEGKTTNGFPTHYSPTDKLVRKKAPSGSACDKHKRWKKRCPDDCPMRKSKSLCRDAKRQLPSDYFDMFRWSIEDSNMVEEYEEEECIEEEEQQVEVTQRSRRSPPRRFEDEMMMSEEEEEEIVVKRKTKKTTIKNSKGRTGRKYLPQACDRHKVLHAKCPANCPDRLKRDTDLANKQRIQNPPGSSSSSEDLLSASNGLADYAQF